jgi:hypothetical protein
MDEVSLLSNSEIEDNNLKTCRGCRRLARRDDRLSSPVEFASGTTPFSLESWTKRPLANIDVCGLEGPVEIVSYTEQTVT